MTTPQHHRIGLFVDVQNIYYTTRETFNKQFNYRALWHTVSAQGEICQAFAYAIDRQQSQQLKFQTALRHIGFDVRLKPYIQRRDGSAKGDWDVGITIDILQCAAQLDRIVLLSGDGDFDLLAETVRERYNIRFDVYGVQNLTAASLIEAASSFQPITEGLLLN